MKTELFANWGEILRYLCIYLVLWNNKNFLSLENFFVKSIYSMHGKKGDFTKKFKCHVTLSKVLFNQVGNTVIATLCNSI